MKTLDLATLQLELTRIEQGVVPITVGNYCGFRHTVRTPAHVFEVVDLVVPELGFLHIGARDSFARPLLDRLIAAFDRVKKKRYQKVLHVYGTFDLGTFDCIGIAPPALTKA